MYSAWFTCIPFSSVINLAGHSDSGEAHIREAKLTRARRKTSASIGVAIALGERLGEPASQQHLHNKIFPFCVKWCPKSCHYLRSTSSLWKPGLRSSPGFTLDRAPHWLTGFSTSWHQWTRYWCVCGMLSLVAYTLHCPPPPPPSL